MHPIDVLYHGNEPGTILVHRVEQLRVLLEVPRLLLQLADLALDVRVREAGELLGNCPGRKTP
jgi:hypothetical protein